MWNRVISRFSLCEVVWLAFFRCMDLCDKKKWVSLQVFSVQLYTEKSNLFSNEKNQQIEWQESHIFKFRLLFYCFKLFVHLKVSMYVNRGLFLTRGLLHIILALKKSFWLYTKHTCAKKSCLDYVIGKKLQFCIQFFSRLVFFGPGNFFCDNRRKKIFPQFLEHNFYPSVN